MLRKDIRALKLPADERTVDFHIAILKVFEHIGDRRALKVVKQLAAKQVWTSGELRIRAAAIACLEVMEPRLAKERIGETLLRASTPADAAPETLLRAAAESSDLAPAEMLWVSEFSADTADP
jgi:hypothetical protein